jgi:spore coat polysaccharide biosynthesis predicted glycosyltransferase SpsG
MRVLSMRRFYVLYDFVPSSLSELENKLINFDIVVVESSHQKRNQAKRYQDEKHTRHITQKNDLLGLGLDPSIVVET